MGPTLFLKRETLAPVRAMPRVSVLLNEHNAEGGLALSAAPADLGRRDSEVVGSYQARSLPGLDQDSHRRRGANGSEVRIGTSDHRSDRAITDNSDQERVAVAGVGLCE
jgi:hypothetical protein